MAKKKGELTPDQKVFCLEYLKDFNATAAAKRAGYSEKTAQEQGSRLLSNVMVQVELKKAMDEVLGNAKADIADIIKELKLIAFSDISDVMDWGIVPLEVTSADGTQTYTREKQMIKIKEKEEMGIKTKLISEMSETESMAGTTRKLKMYDKLRAIELLGKYYKMFTDKVEHTNPDGNLKPQVFVYLPKNGRESS